MHVICINYYKTAAQLLKIRFLCLCISLTMCLVLRLNPYRLLFLVVLFLLPQDISLFFYYLTKKTYSIFDLATPRNNVSWLKGFVILLSVIMIFSFLFTQN